ncbi:phage portal protein [Streptomyces sp. SID8381]|uniref:phage portal protein n=1 Tax=unclassified Streptomyces TaxID=2593676 RepID=UPI00035FFCD7|nr:MULTISPECIES: phage portal protein [unclassified Streptomyces]MYX26045.1 phage portal protein [Streptomyces sp. SID8381]
MIVPPGSHTAFIGKPSKPEEWLQYLYGKLPGPNSPARIYSEYYEGEQQKLAFSQMRYKAAFASVFEQWRDNFCGMIVDATNERLNVDSFRIPGTEGTDKDARQFWQRSSMDAYSNAVHLEALIQGRAYVVVWADQDGEPTITPVSAERMAVCYKAGSLWELEAAARFERDAWGRQQVTLWTEEYVYEVAYGVTEWDKGVSSPNPLKRVPVVPFENRIRLIGEPVSDLANCIPIQDALNKTVMDALTASEAAAFPQRYATGIEIQQDENGNPIAPFNVGVDKLLQAEAPDAKFGSFEAANLQNYVTLVDMLVQHLASVSRVPSHYFLVNSTTPPSGESIISAEAGLVAKVRERMLHFGEAWERVIRLCFAVKKDKRQDAFDMETRWRDPEYRTEAQHVDALLKLKQLNVPEEILWAEAGFSATQIDNFREMRKDDAKAAAEVQKLMPQPEPQNPAAKPPQGNSGNVARKLHEAK